MEFLIALPFVAYLGERLAEKLIKPFIKGVSPYFEWPQELKDYLESIVCAIPGFAVSLLAGLDMFAALGIPLAGYGGPVVTALVVGFGANLVHDLLCYLDNLRGV